MRIETDLRTRRREATAESSGSEEQSPLVKSRVSTARFLAARAAATSFKRKHAVAGNAALELSGAGTGLEGGYSAGVAGI